MSALVVVLATADSRIETKSGALFPILIAIGGIVRVLFQPSPKPRTEEASDGGDEGNGKKDKEESECGGDVHLSKMGGGLLILVWAVGFLILTVINEGLGLRLAWAVRSHLSSPNYNLSMETISHLLPLLCS